MEDLGKNKTPDYQNDHLQGPVKISKDKKNKKSSKSLEHMLENRKDRSQKKTTTTSGKAEFCYIPVYKKGGTRPTELLLYVCVTFNQLKQMQSFFP